MFLNWKLVTTGWVCLIALDLSAKLHAHITLLRERAYEARLVQAVDRVITITREEAAAVKELNPWADVRVIPAMIDTQRLKPVQGEGDRDSLVYVGSFRHPPNVDAMNWFCSEVFDQVRRRAPSAHLYIVGVGGRERIGRLARPGIEIVGTVDDVQAWLSKASVVISPILSGGGARIKNLEALATGRPLVTTSLGAEGLGEPPGKPILRLTARSTSLRPLPHSCRILVGAVL